MIEDALATAKQNGLRVHYLMERDGWWRAILGRGTDMKWGDGETPEVALRAAIEMHAAPDFLS